MKKMLVFSFVCLFLLLGNLNPVFALNLDKMDIEKIYLAVCNSPEQIGSLDEVLKVYDLEGQWGVRFTYSEGMCWVPDKGVFYRGFGLFKKQEINGRIIKVVDPAKVRNITVDLPSVDHVKKIIRKLVPVTGYVHWKTNYRFLVMYVSEIYVHATDGRVLLGYRDPDWNGDIVAFRNAKLLEEAKYFK